MDRLCRMTLALSVVIAGLSLSSLVIRTAPGSLLALALALVAGVTRRRAYR